MKHCPSIWQDHAGIHPVDLDLLSPMSYHLDDRWRTRDLPRFTNDGLWYPLLYYKVTLDWWTKKFANWFSANPGWPYINPPIVNSDGFIWALKLGCNRYRVLKHLGYTSADCILFDDSNKLVELGFYLRDEDPLHNDRSN